MSEENKEEFEKILVDLEDFTKAVRTGGSGYSFSGKFQKSGDVFYREKEEDARDIEYIWYKSNNEIKENSLFPNQKIFSFVKELHSYIEEYSQFTNANFSQLYLNMPEGLSEELSEEYSKFEQKISDYLDTGILYKFDLVFAKAEYKRQEKRLKDLEESGISAAYFAKLHEIITKKETVITLLNSGIWLFTISLGVFSIREYISFDFSQQYILNQLVMKLVSISPFVFLIFLMVRKLRKEEILCEGYRYKASTIAK